MFGVYFGKYLQDVGVLTKEEYEDIVEKSRTARVKMGLLAVNEGMMTPEQADEVNQLQAMKDARFGDIAVEKGYLTDEQVGKLLKKQGDSYLLFVQELVERNLLTLEGIQKHLNNYKKYERFTALDLDALKSADIDKIIPVLTRDCKAPAVVKDYVALVARNIIRFVDNKVRFERMESINTFTGKYIASQGFSGDYQMFIGLSGEGNKVIGEKFGDEEFEDLNEDCLDAVCEFINVSNGLFASRLSEEDVSLDMLPPSMYTDITTISSEGLMFSIPCFFNDKRVDLIVCMEAKWTIN
jgi:CheY-specific phosphatase CheX